MKTRQLATASGLAAIAIAMTLMLAAPAAQALDYYWDTVNIGDGTNGPGDGAITGGGGFTWGTGNTRWTTDGGTNNVHWGNTLSDTAVFTDIGGTIGVNEVNAGGITFNNPSTTGYTLTPLNILHLGAGGVIQTLATDGPHVNTITTKLQLMGTTATFSSDSANSTMEIGNDVTDWMTLGAGVTSATLTLNGTSTGLNRLGSTGTTKNIINSRLIAVVKDGSGTWWVSGRLNFTGGLTIKEGTLVYSHSDSALGTTGITLGNSVGGANDATLVSGSSGRNIGRPITLASSTTGILTIAGGTGIAATTYSGGVTGNNNLTLDSRGTLLTMSTAAINNAGTVTVKGAGNTVISSGIGSSVTSLTKNDAGTLTLSGANSYTGATTVSNGTLVANNLTALGSGSVAITGAVLRLAQSLNISNLAGDAAAAIDLGATGTVLTVNMDGTNTFAGAITNAGALVKTGAGTLTLSGTNTYSGTTTVSNGVLRTTTASTLGVKPDVYLSGGSLFLDFTGINEVNALYIGGVKQPNGVYGSDGLNITGAGYLRVGPAGFVILIR